MNGSSREESVIHWLIAQKDSKARYGGESPENVGLTCLAGVLFNRKLITISSPEHGDLIKEIVLDMLQAAKEEECSENTRALLCWFFSEYYEDMRLPVLKTAALEQAHKLDFAAASPWHLLAAQSMVNSRLAPELGSRGLQSIAESKENEALIRVIASLFCELPKYDYKSSDLGKLRMPLAAEFRNWFEGNWIENKGPFSNSLILMAAIASVDPIHCREWGTHYFQTVRMGQNGDEDFFWKLNSGVKALGEPTLEELREQDLNLYITVLTELASPFYQFGPPFCIRCAENRELIE